MGFSEDRALRVRAGTQLGCRRLVGKVFFITLLVDYRNKTRVASPSLACRMI